MHQALVSIQEELEAVDWYRQRADACEDEELKQILLHNMREEIEHACMVLEWVRRRNPDFAEQMGTYLFTEAPILEVEDEAENGGDEEGDDSSRKDRTRRGFTVGSMKKR
jgi:hypothetical protein